MSDLTDESVKALLDGATPGAWAVNPKAATNVEAGRRGVAACGGYFDNTSDGAYAVENEANAHLIAAAPDLARALLDARAELARVRADAAAAQAMMVERAAEQADPWDGPVTKNKIVGAQAIVAQQVKARIRALAPDAGTAELAKLRERAEKAEQERVAEWNRRRDADGSRDAARAACDTMRAERDTLAASPEVAKRVADAEARGMELAAEILAVRADVLLVDAGADAELVRVLDASVAAIRTAATSLRTGEAG